MLSFESFPQAVKRQGLGSLRHVRLNWLYLIVMAIGLAVGGKFLAEKRAAADKAEAEAAQRAGSEPRQPSAYHAPPSFADGWGANTH